ncbi:tRNA pseudouridine(38-40) synthase TruA [Sphingobacteriales bacterium UPWRP_1]|nr:tRNA pseudouridine(38-40) synthase TruA [Sphingobacteriales bacterium TSM_CSM]PSJ76476.1 tRNA pseudouridine(38-40) synthase TruA [Sphingobacteriales bacterium UPWRP_1]
MPQRYFMEIAYHGKNYIGWQVQPTGISVQAKINEALSLFLRQTVNVVGCGRTDTGVHASTFFLHFEAETPLPEDLMNRLNRYLPPDIAIKRIITQIPDNAHARFDATYRAYNYYIHFNKNPFLTEFSFFFPWRPLNIEVMQQAIELLPQYTDFRMFCKTGAGSKTTLCNLYKAEMHLNETDQTLRFHLAANRFLRGMVRRIVGCLLFMGKDKISLQEFKAVMDGRKSQFPKINISVPPQGLFLSEVRYPYIGEQ